MARTERHALEAIADELHTLDASRVDAVRTRRWALLAVVLLLSALAAWLISPRFAIDAPSLIDDWSAVAKAPDQAAEVIRLENPEEQRFRPAWILWNYVQWHTFGAPGGLAGPNAWNLLRTFVLVAGLVLATALALPLPRTRAEALVHAALAAMPALMVLTFARDLARFGPQEPLLLGGMALGGALLVLAARSVLDQRPPPAWQIVLLALGGSVLWVLGVYQKEVSLAVIPLVAATLYAGRRRFARWPVLAAGRRLALGAIGAVVVVPLAHVAIESARIVARGDLVYDAKVDRGQGVWRGLRQVYGWLPEVYSLNALRLMSVLLVLVVAATVVRQRVDVLALGALASGALAIAFVAQAGVFADRYFIPVFALAAAAIVISLARFSIVVHVAGLAALILIVLKSVALAHTEVQDWTDRERAGAALVRQVADAHATGCPVATAGLELETREALPVLVDWADGDPSGACSDGVTYLVLRLPAPDSTALAGTCARGALEPVLEDPIATVYRCSRLGAEPVRDPTYGLVAPDRLIQLRRLRL